MPTFTDRRGPARLTDSQYVELLRNLGNEIPEHLRPMTLTPFEEEYVRELRRQIEEQESLS